MLANQGELAVQRAAQTLRGLGLGELAAALLHHGGPLAFWGAQALYAATPLLSVFDTGADLNELAAVLEDPQAAQALAGILASESGAKPA